MGFRKGSVMKRTVLITAIICFVVLNVPSGVLAKVNLNTASITELQTLPRIGQGLAQAIVDYRDLHGPFRSIHEITKVPKIGDKTFESLKDFITVGSVPQVPPKTEYRTVDASSSSEDETGYAYHPIEKIQPDPLPTATPAPTVEEIMVNFIGEPSINDVHRTALDYAKIHQNQFTQWRRNVRQRALLPETFQVTVGHDTDDDTDYARSKSISLSSGTVTIGPDDETWEHDTDDDWDYELRLKWNFQDYVFHTDMLRVSAETEDQVELRQDILNEVTKLYFDRRRLQIEMILDNDVDVYSQMKRAIRLEELNAALDAMTGGYFTRKLQENSANE